MTSYDDKPWLKFYDEHVPAEIPIPGITYLEFLMAGLSADPGKPAIYFLGKKITFKDLDDWSDRFAAYLVECGCQKGDVIAINLPNLPQYLISLAGISKAGCIASGASPLLTSKELRHQLNDSQAILLVTMDMLFEERFFAIKDQVEHLKHIVVTGIADFLPPVKRVLGTLLKKIPTGKVEPVNGKSLVTFKEMLANTPPKKIRTDITPDDVCVLQYTGGTTGPSKGTVITNANMMVNITQLVQWADRDMDPDKPIMDLDTGRDVICSGFPFFHQAGLGVGMGQMGQGNTQVLVPDPRNTSQICKDIKKYNPTFLVNVPTLYQMLMDDPAFGTIDFSNVKYCLSGAAPFDVDSIKKLESFVGEGKAVELFGMTETSPLITSNPVFGKKKFGSVGLPIQNTRIKIVDVESGESEVPVGEPGELIVNGPQVMKEYHNKPEATADTIKNFQGERWLYTGDVARMDEDGYIYIVDRTKDMLLVGGFNVYSKQVEETLYEIPEIEFCAIVGVQNPERPGSELVKAVIQLVAAEKDGDKKKLENKIITHCKEYMAAYKVPKIVEFVDEMPLTAVGKVDKKVLRV